MVFAYGGYAWLNFFKSAIAVVVTLPDTNEPNVMICHSTKRLHYARLIRRLEDTLDYARKLYEI